MKTFLRAALAASAFLVCASLTRAWGMAPCRVDCGAYLNWSSGCHLGCQLGPWYTYFPYNAHFQSPAPVCGWPFWPTGAAQNAVPTGAVVNPGPAGSAQGAYPGTPGIRPVGYYGNAPSYWYND